jgi:thioredoxin-related protein
MKKWLALFVIASIGFAFSKYNKIEPIKIGTTMPMADLKLVDVTSENKEKSLSDLKGTNGTLVMFSCNTCPYVIANQNRTMAVAKVALGLNVGVAIVNSNEAKRGSDDSAEKMKTYANGQSYYFSYLVDTNHKLADAFGAQFTPECFLFNKEGKLVYYGAIDNSPKDETKATTPFLENALQELATGKDITVKTSKAIGCSIKRNK